MADLEQVRQRYREALSDLTDARPIITFLTQIAEEDLPSAPAIVQAIEDQLRNVSCRLHYDLFSLKL
jgi:hypothetical protein